jgi:hypothetical protein
VPALGSRRPRANSLTRRRGLRSKRCTLRELVVNLPTMAFIVSAPRDTFEIRESRSTPAGPRSRTLVTFKVLNNETIEKAGARAAKALDPDQLRQMARRAGAPVAAAPADRAARSLIAELTRGRSPEPTLRRLLVDALENDNRGVAEEASPRPLSDSARSAAAWLAATPQLRGEALRDLLLLGDALPARKHEGARRFPRMESGPA